MTGKLRTLCNVVFHN